MSKDIFKNAMKIIDNMKKDDFIESMNIIGVKPISDTIGKEFPTFEVAMLPKLILPKLEINTDLKIVSYIEVTEYVRIRDTKFSSINKDVGVWNNIVCFGQSA